MDLDDLKLKRCDVCGWEFPPDTLINGVCEDCQEKLDEEYEEAHAHDRMRGGKHRYDDER